MTFGRRFTLDGSAALEKRLAEICDRVKAGVQGLIPARKIEALVLGGGYGRGEGGVLRTSLEDEPYNDLEFYIFLRGPRLWNQRKYASALRALGEELSACADVHVEFKIDSLRQLRFGPVSMFTYDLVSAHRVLIGREGVFDGCERHLSGSTIPLSEATRLLYNRCTGLLLARELLSQETALTDEQSDFIGRNIAKASLALGDAVLVSAGKYHWSARVRGERLRQLGDPSDLPEFPAVRKRHRAGIEFKLNPRRMSGQREDFASDYREVSGVARKLWLWIESRRLNRSFSSIREYAFCDVNKCPEFAPGKNYFLTMRTFGPGAALDPMAGRYPRERLFNSLPLLLWSGEVLGEPEATRHLRVQLRSLADDWNGFVAAYKGIWPAYG